MALLVWLPLMGNLENKGLKNVGTSTLGTITYENGKLGQAARIGSGTQVQNGISIDSNLLEDLGSEYSCSVWVKPTGAHVHYEGAILSSGDWNKKKWAFGIGQNNTTIDPFGPSYSIKVPCTVPVDEWTHIASTVKDNIATIYKNGVQVGTYNFGNLVLESDAANTTIGRETYASGYFSFNGCIQDIRIYNHCLSPLEVKEISKGLVLHYSLAMPGGENLMPNSLQMQLGSASPSTGTWRLAGSSTMKKSRVQIDGITYGFQNEGIQTANDGSCYGIDSFPMSADTQYTISFDARIVSGTEGYAGFNIYSCTINGGSYTKIDKNYYVTPLTTNWTRCWVTFTTNSNTTRNIYIGITTGDTSVTTQMCRVKLECGSRPTPWLPNPADAIYSALGFDDGIEYDVSGYGNNGTRNGTFSWSGDTPRYETSAVFNGSSDIRSAKSSFGWFDFKEGTVSAWFKPANTTQTWASVGVQNDGGAGSRSFSICNYSGKAATVVGYDSSWGNQSSGYSMAANTWYHLCATITNGDTVKLYVNGELVQTRTVTNTTGTIASTTQFAVGVDLPGSDERFTGQLSDVRFYTTCLNELDVRDLYSVAASIADNGTLMASEVSEL